MNRTIPTAAFGMLLCLLGTPDGSAQPAASHGGAPGAAAPGADALGAPTAGLTRADSIAERVQRFYDRTDTIQARFRQSYYHRVYQRWQRSSGALVVDQPGRMRFDYDAPNGKVVVSDGTHLTAWEPGEEGGAGQYVKAPVGDDALTGALGFLSGNARIREDYRVRLLDAERYRWSGHVLELRPRVADPRVARILLFVDGREAAAGVVHRVRFYDHERNINTFTLLDMRLDREVSAERFHFTPPRGARRVDA